MKKHFLGAAAALAVVAPGVAAAQTTGSVGLHYGNLDIDGGGDADIYGLDVGVAHDFGGWTLQADGVSERVDFGGGGDVGFGNVSVAAGVRNENHAVYGFVGHTSFLADSLNIGIGGQYHLDRITFNGSIGYADFDGADLTAVNVDGTYYFTDNFGVLAEVSYGELSGGGDPDWTSVGIGGVYRFTGSPVSVDFGYRKTDGDAFDSDLLRLGVSVSFGTSSARDAARNGPSFNGGRNLYNQTLNVF